MKKVSKKIYFLTFMLICIFGVAYSFSHFFSPFEIARAGVGQNVTGYAWSDNGGWISFNNTDTGGGVDYGVSVEIAAGPTYGDFSGYAWSDVFGWISFNAADLSVCPGGAVAAKLDDVTNKVSGYARVLAGSGDGKGCIKLSESTVAPVYPGVTYDTVSKKFQGYAWEPDVLGWVSFNCVDSSSCGTSNYAVNFGGLNTPPVASISTPIEGPNSFPVGLIGIFGDELGDTFASYKWYEGACMTGVELSSGAGGSNPTVEFFPTPAFAPGSSHTISFQVCDNHGACSCDTHNMTVTVTECSDSSDNDGDGRQNENDPGCYTDWDVTKTFHIDWEERTPKPQCADGIDDGSNGLFDDGGGDIYKADPGCYTGNSTSTGTYVPANSESYCGDRVCGSGENIGSCPVDCKLKYKVI